MKIKFTKTFALLLGLAFFCQSASADLVVTSENFDGTATGGFQDFGAQGGGFANNAFHFGIAGWGESVNDNPGGFTDFLLDIGNGGVIDPGQTVLTSGLTAGFQSTGYIYREIGTNSGFSSVNVSGLNVARANADQANDVNVELFTLDAGDAFAFAEFGNDISTATGVMLVGSQAASHSDTRGDTVAFSFDFDMSGQDEDDRIFVRFSSVNDGPLAYVDNLTFSSVAVPEPGSAGLIALAICGIGMLRRRNN